MDFSLSDRQTAWRDRVRAFIDAHVAPATALGVELLLTLLQLLDHFAHGFLFGLGAVGRREGGCQVTPEGPR